MKSFLDKKVIIFSIVSLVLGFLIGSEYRAYRIAKSFSEVFETDNTTQEISENINSEEEKYSFVNRELGDQLEFVTANIVINSSQEKTSISSNYSSPKTAKEGTTFVVINLNITNSTSDSFTFYPDDVFQLVDDQDRKFETYKDTIGYIDNYLNVRELAPSITEKGVIVYEIPDDSEHYYLLAYRSDTQEAYRIQLK